MEVLALVEERKRKTVSPTKPETSLAKPSDQTGLTKEIDSMFDEFRRSFDDFPQPFFPLTTDLEQAMTLPTRYPSVDLADNGDAYTVTAELPGFNKENIDVQVNNDGLSIMAENKEEKEEKHKNYLHRERAYSSMQRFVAFPEEVIPSKVEGEMKNGVLELKIPKKEPKQKEKPHKVEIK